jgi:hypothetical protein
MGAASKWDPATTRGDHKEALTERLRGLKIGERLEMPDGTRVSAAKSKGRQGQSRWFVVSGSGPTDQASKATANEAAEVALSLSARSSHPESLGGDHPYTDFSQYRDNQY